VESKDPHHAWESPPPPQGILTMHSRQNSISATTCGFRYTPLPAHGQMQMRASSAARASAQSDRLPFADVVPFLDGKFRQMKIERQQALTVVDHHTIPFKEQRPGPG